MEGRGRRRIMNLAAILSQGESETVEFKASFNDEALETIGAFANAAGGVLLIIGCCPMLVRPALFAACKTVETES
jgi:hypothetical protein